jgi:hypothetical protein
LEEKMDDGNAMKVGFEETKGGKDGKIPSNWQTIPPNP